MTGETVTSGLPGVVREIRLRSMKYMASKGVMKELVHTFTGGDVPNGSQVSEPVFDPTGYAGTAGTEGTTVSANTITLTTTRRAYTATEWVATSFITYDDLDESSENVKEMAAQAHGHAHAEKLETKCLAVFASFTTHTITATSTSGLSWAKVAAGKTKLEDQQYDFAGVKKNLVISGNAEYLLAVELARNTNYGPSGDLGNKVLNQYHVATILGDVSVYRTSYLTATSLQVCGMFVPSAIGLFVSRNYRMREQEIVRHRGWDVVSSLKSGARVRQVPGGVKYTVYGKTPS